jgi:hypothetical protein
MQSSWRVARHCSFQNREVTLVASPALKPLVLHEQRLLPHPEPGCNTSRTVIVAITPGHDAVKAGCSSTPTPVMTAT